MRVRFSRHAAAAIFEVDERGGRRHRDIMSPSPPIRDASAQAPSGATMRDIQRHIGVSRCRCRASIRFRDALRRR